RALLTALIITALMGTIVFVLWIGARQVQAGTLSMGELGAFLIYAALVAGGVGTLAEVWGDVMRASGATGRLLELLHAEPAIRDPGVDASSMVRADDKGSRLAPLLPGTDAPAGPAVGAAQAASLSGVDSRNEAVAEPTIEFEHVVFC